MTIMKIYRDVLILLMVSLVTAVPVLKKVDELSETTCSGIKKKHF
jgi:hypothetical protein